MHEARFYEKLPGKKVHCRLCPHECRIEDGKRGICRVRLNTNGILSSEIYGMTTGVALDPIEKKPLYHFHPGEYILSIGTKGCNLGCDFCQNYSISQRADVPMRPLTTSDVIEAAREAGSFGIAYTYNEPFIWYEFVFDTARLAKEKGLSNVLVTNGYVNVTPLEEILPFIDAMNIDLKAFNDQFYRKICKGSLDPVLKVIERAHRSCHVELTTLIIPTLNEDAADVGRMVDWIAGTLGSDVPLHLSRYFPCYKMKLPPTPVATLKKAEEIARKKLKYVYLGNV